MKNGLISGLARAVGVRSRSEAAFPRGAVDLGAASNLTRSTYMGHYTDSWDGLKIKPSAKPQRKAKSAKKAKASRAKSAKRKTVARKAK